MSAFERADARGNSKESVLTPVVFGSSSFLSSDPGNNSFWFLQIHILVLKLVLKYISLARFAMVNPQKSSS